MLKPFRTFALLVVAAVGAAAFAVARAVTEIPTYVAQARGYITRLAVALLVGPPMRQDPDPARPSAPRARAHAYRLRLDKRERVLISPSWRMCPSC